MVPVRYRVAPPLLLLLILILILILILTPLALPLSANSQQHPPPVFRDELEIREVLLKVQVTDGDGRPVRDLDLQDFQVTENGRRAEVTGATFLANRRFEEPPTPFEGEVAPQAASPVRHFILFFHDLRRSDRETLGVQSQQIRAARESRQWVLDHLQPGDRVAVVMYDYRLKVYQDFTAEKSRVAEAIDRLVTRRPARESRLDRRRRNARTSLLAGLPAGPRLRDATPHLYEGIRLLAEATGRIQGQKSLLLFSIGVDPQGTRSRGYSSLVATLRRSRLILYALDLTSPDAEHAAALALNELALDSGGQAYFHVASFLKPLRQIDVETAGYYLLSYRPPAAREGDRPGAQIEVRVQVPGCRVRFQRTTVPHPQDHQDGTRR